jgi:hypothetical protein
MTRTQRNLVLAAGVIAATIIAGGMWWLLREPAVEPGPDVVVTSEAPARASDPAIESKEGARGERLEVQPKPAARESTVVIPLVLELELLRSDYAPKADGVAPLGSGATARIKGSIHAQSGEGVRAEVRFIAGANVPRVLYCDRDGGFGATDLYPGLSIVRVTGPGISGSMREVLLRQDRESLLSIGYGRPAIIRGEVFTRDGQPLADAKVAIDGIEVFTDERGEFVVTNVASGERVLVIVEKPGYATYRELRNVVAATTTEKGEIKFSLQPGARLAVDIAESINSDVQAQLYVLPANVQSQRKYPWFRLNPVMLFPGGSKTLDDLPAGPVQLRLFHAGAQAEPPSVVVDLTEGNTAHQTLHLKPAPVITGVVKENGKPVERAKVRLEVPDRVVGMVATLGAGDALALEREVYPSLPTAVQETTTTALGEFQLSASEAVSRQRYVVATSPDGKSTGGAVLRGGESSVEIAISPLSGGEGEIVVQMDARYQPLPVRVIVNNQPRDELALPPGQDLHVAGLTQGLWKLNVRWDTETLLSDSQIELSKSVTVGIQLPQGAIVGQDEDLRKRLHKN